ncbi:hypothetical protein F4777DRAFT_502877 [Nemania sp. FL0916]|nr:hypothetical protein F4777DRAFT_502877 [Nemania sp. FL0916]
MAMPATQGQGQGQQGHHNSTHPHPHHNGTQPGHPHQPHHNGTHPGKPHHNGTHPGHPHHGNGTHPGHMGGIILDLDKAGKLEWIAVSSGRLAHIPKQLIDEYYTSTNQPQQQQQSRRSLEERDDIGDIDNKPAEADCFDSGKVMSTTILTGLVPGVCSDLLAQTQAGKVLNTAWTVVHKEGVRDQVNRLADVFFGVAVVDDKDKDNHPTLTLDLCKKMMDKMFDGAPCGENLQTRGAKGVWDGVIEFIADPWYKA